MIRVVVTEHAMWRAAERFPWFDTVTIGDEVIEALREGRLSVEKPPHVSGNRCDEGVYVWTPDGRRIYVVRNGNDDCFVVITTLGVN